MDAAQLARQAYAPTTFSLKSDGAIEAQAFGKVTAQLRRTALEQKSNFPAYAKALHDNRRLWIILATDVADRDNSLSDKLRAQIFYLAEFTEFYTAKILREGVPPEPLIEINTSILRGLKSGASK